MATPRVLLLVDRLGRGGAAQVVVNTALTLDRERFSPIVCTTRRVPANDHDRLLREAGVPLVELNRRSRVQVSHWAPLWRILPGVSILHAHESGSSLWGRVWGRLFRVPVIITQDHTAADAKLRPAHWSDRLMSPLSDRIVAVSEFSRELALRVEKLPPEKVVTIYNGIDVAGFAGRLSKEDARRRAGLPAEGLLLAVVGRLDPAKNHQGLFEALALLPEDVRSQSRCLVVGSGTLEGRLRSEVRRLGLQEVVSFLGERSDVPAILSAADLFVLPSHTECLPLVLLEALAAGCPVVATAVGGVPEVLDGLGWPMVDPGDPGGLAAAIAGVVRMPAEPRDAMIAAGRQAVIARFSKEASAARVEELYLSLLASRGRRRSGGGIEHRVR